LGLGADFFPALTAFDAFIKILYTLFNIVTKHVLDVYLLAATFDD